MVVILLPLLCNHDNLILKLYQEENSYLHEEWLLIDRFKVGNLPEMRNKKLLVLFICKSV